MFVASLSAGPKFVRYSSTVLLRYAIWAVAVAIAACAGANNLPSDAGPTWPPAECDGLATPFLGEDCLGRFHEICRSHDNQEACIADGRARVGDGYVVYCNWVPLVVFSDESTCEVASTGWRCEAHIELNLLPCLDPCEVSPSLHSAWKAIPSEHELIKMCGVPLGPWLTVESTSLYARSCHDNTTPPAPAICDCTPAACEVTRGAWAEPLPSDAL